MSDIRRLKYRQQRQNARNRGIEWRLTFEEWWAVWDESGRFSERGTKLGCFCMARNNDDGPYAVGNVSIQTVSQNSSTKIGRQRIRWLKRPYVQVERCWENSHAQRGSDPLEELLELEESAGA